MREVLGQISAGALTRYPEREPVEAIVAAHLGSSAEQVALTNGVDEAIHVLFETFLEAGDELLLPVPTYTMYEVYASATDARVVTVQAADDLQFPFERLLAAITPRTKVIAIANPNSPSGSVATREQLLELARRAPQAVLLVDEAYFHFYGETVMDLVGAVPNLVVARTFSKAYGLAGLRLGLLAGPAELMRWVRRVLSPYSVNSLALACLPAALEDTAYLDWYVGEVLAARSEFEAALDAAGVRRWPSRANFVLVEIGARHAEFVRLMRAAGVLVRDRSSDPGCDGRVRITIGTREQMRQAAAALNEALAALRAGGEEAMTTKKSKTAGRQAGARTATVVRNTTETRIELELTIEGQGQYNISTGIRFFDHMLELFTRHGAFDLALKCDGDLDVDQHHTVEDVGIALGEAFDRALGDKRGILRAGYFVMPMDETLADCGRGLERARGLCRGHEGAHAAGGRFADGAGDGFLRGVCARRAGQCAREDDVRALESSQDRGDLQGICAGAARGLLARQATGQDAAVDEGAFVRSCFPSGLAPFSGPCTIKPCPGSDGAIYKLEGDLL